MLASAISTATESLRQSAVSSHFPCPLHNDVIISLMIPPVLLPKNALAESSETCSNAHVCDQTVLRLSSPLCWGCLARVYYPSFTSLPPSRSLSLSLPFLSLSLAVCPTTCSLHTFLLLACVPMKEAAEFYGGKAEDVPLVMWMNGGPGASSLTYGYFSELGPFYFDDHSMMNHTEPGVPDVMANPYSWTRVANMLFIESPPSVGYS